MPCGIFTLTWSRRELWLMPPLPPRHEEHCNSVCDSGDNHGRHWPAPDVGKLAWAYSHYGCIESVKQLLQPVKHN